MLARTSVFPQRLICSQHGIFQTLTLRAARLIEMEDSDIEQGHSPKRRRISNDNGTPGYGSPDELGADSDHAYTERRNSDFRRERTGPRDISYPGSASPDELDHTIPTPRESDRYDRSDVESRDGSSTPTPRNRTPISFKPKEAVFLPYKLRTVLQGHKRGVAAVRFSPDGRMIASCCK